MEIETVMNYIANSINPDRVTAREIVEALEPDMIHVSGFADPRGA